MWQLKWEKKTRIDDDISTGRCSRFRVVAPVGEKSEWLIQKNVFSMERLSWRLFSVVAVASEHTHKISTLLRFQCVRLKIGLAILVQANAGFFIGRSLNGFPWVKYIKNVENSMTIHEWEMSSFVEPAVHSQSIFFFSRHKNRTTNWAKGRSSCHTWILCRAVIDFQIRDVPSMKWRCDFYSNFPRNWCHCSVSTFFICDQPHQTKATIGCCFFLLGPSCSYWFVWTWIGRLRNRRIYFSFETCPHVFFFWLNPFVFLFCDSRYSQFDQYFIVSHSCLQTHPKWPLNKYRSSFCLFCVARSVRRSLRVQRSEIDDVSYSVDSTP